MHFAEKHGLYEITIRITALVLCVILASSYFASNLLAKYTSSATGSDNAIVASLGEVAISGGGAFVSEHGITPGVDITNVSLTVSRTPSETDVASWVILAFDLGNYWDVDNYRLYLNQSKIFTFKHEVNTNTLPLFFDIDRKVTTFNGYSYQWIYGGTQTVTVGGVSKRYAFYAQRVDSGINGTIKQPNIVNNNMLYVSAEINTDDIIAMNTYADSISVKPYLVSRYGYSTDASLSSLCAQLCTEVISKE